MTISTPQLGSYVDEMGFSYGNNAFVKCLSRMCPFTVCHTTVPLTLPGEAGMATEQWRVTSALTAEVVYEAGNGKYTLGSDKMINDWWDLGPGPIYDWARFQPMKEDITDKTYLTGWDLAPSFILQVCIGCVTINIMISISTSICICVILVATNKAVLCGYITLGGVLLYLHIKQSRYQSVWVRVKTDTRGLATIDATWDWMVLGISIDILFEI